MDPPRTAHYPPLLILSLLILQALSAAPLLAEEEDADIISPAHYMPAGALAGSVVNITVSAQGLPETLSVMLDSPNSTLELTPTISQAGEGLFTLTITLPEETPPATYDILVVSNGTVIAREPNSLAVFQNWPSPLRIVQFTDIHVGLVHGDRPATSFLAAGLLFAEIAGAHLTIATGDNVDVGGMTAQYKDLLWVSQAFPLPKFFVPGNHERSGDPTLTNWLAYMGPQAYYAQRWGPFLFVGLDSSVNGYVPENQLDWLEQVLEENADAPVKILFTHYPLFRTKLTGEYQVDPQNIQTSLSLFYSTWANNPQVASRFVDIIDRYNVTLVLAGHVHADGFVIMNGKTLFVTTTSTGGGVREGDYRGAKLIEVYPNGTARIIPTPGAQPFDDDTAVNLQKLDARLIEGINTLSLVVEANEFKDAQHAACCIMTLAIRVPENILGENTTVVALSPGYKLPTNLTRGVTVALASAEVPIDPNMNFTLIATIMEDQAPPTIEVYSIRPKTPRMERDQVEITFKATDDAWGIKRLSATALMGGEQVSLPVIDVGRGFYKTVVPPSNEEIVSVRITAVDVSGKTSQTQWINITYRPPPETQAQPSPTTTPSPTQTTQAPEEYGQATPTQTQTTTQTTPPSPTTTTPPEATTTTTPIQTALPPTTTTTQEQSPSPTQTTTPAQTQTPESQQAPQEGGETPAPSTTQTTTQAGEQQPGAREGGFDAGMLILILGLVIAGAAVAVSFKRR